MRKFQFSLETVLRVRKEKENVARKKLLEGHVFLFKQKKNLEKLVKKKEMLEAEMRDVLQGSIDTEKIKALHYCMDRLNKNLEMGKQILLEAEISLFLSRKATLKAMMQRKVIEKYKNRKFSEWLFLYQEWEKSFLDELSMLQYVKTKRDRGREEDG